MDISPHGGTHFQELFERQKSILEEPSDAERQTCFKVFEVTEDNSDVILGELLQLVRESS